MSCDDALSDESDFVGGLSTRRRYEKKVRQTSNAEILRRWQVAQSTNLFARTSPTSPEQTKPVATELFKYLEGRPEYWHLPESAQEFVNRCPPLSSEGLGPWLWVYNPNPEAERRKDGRETGNIDGLCAERCEELLDKYLETEKRIQDEMKGKAQGTITRKLTPLRTVLREKLLAVAREENAVCGKWMLFPEEKEVSRTWKIVVEGVIQNRLGHVAKVATGPIDEIQGRGRALICVYTKDFTDEDDVRRVLEELVELELCPREGNGICYKCDAFTYLGINSNNPYGLKASIYSSRDVLMGDGPKASISSSRNVTRGEKQATLGAYLGGRK
ncbi:hypothetical protein MBLNU457_7466t1 [Dothideomycetes sp. NU457]